MNQRNLYSLLFILCFGCLAAQRNPQPYFRNYNTEDGLPSPEVYIAFEDSEGFMWFGTDNGVARFDGYEFKNYGPKEGLMSAVVFDIHEDRKGRLWFGTLSGEVFILGMDRDRMVPYRFNEVLQEFERKYDKVFLEGISEDSVCFFDVVNFGLLSIKSNGELDSIRSKSTYSKVIIDIKELENPITTTSFNKLDPNFDRLAFQNNIRRANDLEIFTDSRVLKFEGIQFSSKSGDKHDAQRLPNGEIILGNSSYFYVFSDSSLIFSVKRNCSANEIYVEGEAIWLCQTKQNGLSYFKNFENFRLEKEVNYLNGKSVSNIFFDSKGGFWVTSLQNGVFYSDDLQLKTFDSNIGINNDEIVSITFGNSGYLYVGCKSREIYQLDIEKGVIVEEINSDLAEDDYEIFFDKINGDLYCGFLKYSEGNWEETLALNPYVKAKRKARYSDLKSIVQLSTNELIAVDNQGIIILDQKAHYVKFISSRIKDERYFSIHKDFEDNLWVGKMDGIFKYSITDSTYTSPEITHPAFHSRVEDITELPDSTLAFATKGYGVMLWKGEYYRQISDEDGLTSNMLEDLHVDENGILWAGTLNGLNKITIGSLGNPQVRTFNTNNGLPSNEIYQIKSQNGQVWLATGGGLVKFHERPENTESLAPILQSVEVNNEELKNESVVDFSHDKNNFEFRFLAINYRMSGKIPYRYRIHPEDDWEYTQNRTVNYPSLPKGKYAFEIQAQNEDRYWSESTIYEFSVLPSWWATWWFRSLAITALGFLGFLFYKNRIRQIEKESDFQKQITDLEKSALQAQMNPHFIFNCLNSIQNFILQNDKKKAVEYLSRFAKLVRHNLNASVNGTISLDEEINLLENYLALEQQRFEGKFDYEITASDSLIEKYLEIPPMLIQPYVENAIIHGISGKPEKGLIKISFSENEGLLTIKITDDGVGYSKNVIGSTNHKSVGMTITKKRLALLEQNSNNPVQINKLINKENNPNGTEVIIQITTKK